MSLPPFRHLPLLTGDVRLTLTSDDGQEVSTSVSAAWLRAKCIGILADIDPSGLVISALGQQTSGIHGDALDLSMADQILVIMGTGPKTARGLQKALGGAVGPRDIGGRTTQLRESGLIYRIDQGAGKRGGRAIWKLTRAGELRSAQLSGKAQ